MHVTVSLLPAGTFAVGAVLSEGYFKLIFFVVEFGICWMVHLP